jgi:hypothetical protein
MMGYSEVIQMLINRLIVEALATLPAGCHVHKMRNNHPCGSLSILPMSGSDCFYSHTTISQSDVTVPVAHTMSLMNRLSLKRIPACVRTGTAVMLLLALCASAQQFSVTSWGHKDGLPSTTVYALTQSKDGFLWIGTGDGLIRFDGFQYVQAEMPSAALQPLGPVTALVSLQSDGLLIGTAAGLLIIWNGKIAVHTMLDSAVEHLQDMEDHTIEVKTHNKIFHLGNNLSTISSEAISDLQADRAEERSLAQEVHLNHSSESAIPKILPGAGGATWLATENDGPFRIGQRGDLQHFTNSTGLPRPLTLQGSGVYLEYGETLHAKDGQEIFRPRPNWRYSQHRNDCGDAKASACKG